MLAIQVEHDKCHTELSKTSTSALELERKLLSTKAELTRYHELAKKLQDTITITQNDLKTTTIHLQMEKKNNKELQAMVESLNGTLEQSGKKLEGVDLQFALNKKELVEKKLELQQMAHENRTLRCELKQAQHSQATTESERERSEQEVKSLNAELAQAQERVLSLSQKLSTAFSNIESYKHQLEQYQDRLTSNTAENAKLIKDTKISEMEMDSVRANLLAANRQLSEKKELLFEKEEELSLLKQEKISLTSDLAESKREIHSLTSFQTKLENDLKSNKSQLEMEQARITKVRLV